MTAELEDLKQAIGNSAAATDVVTAAAIARLAATLDVAAPAAQPGDPIPAGWHTAFFSPLYPSAAARPDGQAAGGGLVPAIPLQRQRLGGERMTFHEPLRIGDEMTRESVVADLRIERTADGPAVYLDLRNRISCARGLAVVEERTMFYLDNEPPVAKTPAPASPAWRRVVHPTPLLLFRYGAIRFNSHRVHFDRDFAMRTEGLPGLIVHGTLEAQLLLELCRQEMPARRIAGFDYDNRYPIYDTGPFTVAGRPSADGRSAELWVADADGGTAMTATACFAD